MSERRLSPADACWLYSDFEGNHQTVSALMWLDRQIDPDDYRQLIQERLLDVYPTFRQKIRPSRNPLLMPSWVDDEDFDLDYHVDVITLPEPGDRAALEKLVSEQRSQMLDHTRPLWRFHMIQGYEGTTAIHARIQHAIADGWALVRLIMSLADEAVDAEQVKIIDRERKRKRDRARSAVAPAVDAATAVVGGAAAAASGATDAVTEALRNPRTIPAQLASGVEALTEVISLTPDPARFVEFGSGLAEQAAEVPGAVAEQVSGIPGAVVDQATGIPAAVVERAAPLSAAGSYVSGAVDFLNAPKPGKSAALHGTVSGHKKVAWIDPIPLAPIKDAGKVFGATINDMLVAATTSALRAYLLEKGALDVEGLLVSVPVSLRRADEPLPRELGNRFGLVNVLLPVGIEDPVEAVRSIKAEMDEIKKSTVPVVSFGLASVAAITTPQAERAIHKITQEQHAGVVTNVPGPRGPLTLAGANVVGSWGLGGVAANMNLCVGIFSLNGEINFAVSTDTAITPDPERIVELFPAAVQTLLDRAGVSADEQ